MKNKWKYSLIGVGLLSPNLAHSSDGCVSEVIQWRASEVEDDSKFFKSISRDVTESKLHGDRIHDCKSAMWPGSELELDGERGANIIKSTNDLLDSIDNDWIKETCIDADLWDDIDFADEEIVLAEKAKAYEESKTFNKILDKEIESMSEESKRQDSINRQKYLNNLYNSTEKRFAKILRLDNGMRKEEIEALSFAKSDDKQEATEEVQEWTSKKVEKEEELQAPANLEEGFNHLRQKEAEYLQKYSLWDTFKAIVKTVASKISSFFGLNAKWW